MSFFSNFFLVSLIVLRHYHIRFEVPRCKNEHFYLFIMVKFWLLSNFSAFMAIIPFFFTWKVHLFLWVLLHQHQMKSISFLLCYPSFWNGFWGKKMGTWPVNCVFVVKCPFFSEGQPFIFLWNYSYTDGVTSIKK